MIMFQASLHKCPLRLPVTFRINPKPLVLAQGPLWSGSFLRLQPVLLMGLQPLTDTPASFSRSCLPCSASPGPWHSMDFALLCCLVTPAHRSRCFPSSTFSERLLLSSPTRRPSSGQSLTAQQAAPRFLQARPQRPRGSVSGGLSRVPANRVWLCSLQCSRGLAWCLSQCGCSVNSGECVKKHVVFAKFMPGGSLQHHRPGPHENYRRTMSRAPHAVCTTCPLCGC